MRITVPSFLLAALSLWAPASAYAGPITSIVTPGGYVYSPFAVDSSLEVLQAERVGGVLHLVGRSGSLAAAQTVAFGDGGPVASKVRLYPSLSSQAGPGGAVRGEIRDVREIDGRAYYVGNSRSPNTVFNDGEATVWDPATGEARGLGFAHAITQSTATGLSSAGVMSGMGGNASVYTLDGDSRLLPIGRPAEGQVSGARGISADGSLVVGWDYSTGGAAFWRATDPGTLEYTLHSAGFLQTPEGLLLGAAGLMAFSDPVLGEIGLFETFDPLTFGSGVGAWNLSDGSFLRYFGEGGLADAKIYGDELVVAVNGVHGSFLTTLSDPTSLSMSDLFGPELSGLSFAKGGLYEGSLGFVALSPQSGGGSFGVSYQIAPASVPEPSSLLLFAVGASTAAAATRKRRRRGAHA